MKNLTEAQNEILNLAITSWNIASRLKYSRMDVDISDLETILREIKITKHDKTPAYVRIAKDNIHATVFNNMGVPVIYNQRIAHNYIKEANSENYIELPHADNNIISTAGSMENARQFLLQSLATAKKLPVFRNGNFYKETKLALSEF